MDFYANIIYNIALCEIYVEYMQNIYKIRNNCTIFHINIIFIDKYYYYY